MELWMALAGLALALVALLFGRSQIRIAKRQLELSRRDSEEAAQRIARDIITGYFFASSLYATPLTRWKSCLAF